MESNKLKYAFEYTIGNIKHNSFNAVYLSCVKRFVKLLSSASHDHNFIKLHA